MTEYATLDMRSAATEISSSTTEMPQETKTGRSVLRLRADACRQRPTRIATIAASTPMTMTVPTRVTMSAAVSESATAIALAGHESHCVAGEPSTSATSVLPPIAASPPTVMSDTSRALRHPSG